MNISSLIVSHRDFFKSQQTKDLSFRKKSLKALKAEILLREQDIYKALKADFGKSEFETYLSEIGIVLADINLAIKNLKQWSKPERVKSSLLNFPSSDYIYSEPYGTVLILSPWNYPFQLALAPLIMAVATGNTVVLKPSEMTLNTSEVLQDIINTVFQSEHVSTVIGGISLGQELLQQRWDYIFFTGSVSVGKIVAKAAAEHLTPTTLELGGKSPCIVDSSVNLKLAARRIIWGKLLNGGQTCIAPDYLIVHNTIKQDFIKAIINEIERAYGKNPLSSEDYPQMINAKHLDRLEQMLKDQSVIYGGSIDKENCLLSPTLIDNPSLNSYVMQEEIFGPILPILTYENDGDINNIINHFEKPLSFYVFSKHKTFVKRILKRYSFGGGVVNDTLIHFGSHQLPFGGVGHSGIGAYHGKYGFDTFSHKKAIIKKANWLDIPTRYAPYKGKLKLLKWFFKYLS